MNILFGQFGESITFTNVILRVVTSLLIGGIIGFERERKNRPAGLRTHMLVCLASSLIAIVEQQMVYEVATLGNPQINVSVGRLTVGVISGIGFIGAGTIMMSKSRIVGLTTAASLWCAALLGLVNGMGYSGIAFISGLIVIAVLEVMRVGEKTSLFRIIEMDYIDDDRTVNEIRNYFKENNIHVKDSSVSYHKENGKKYCSGSYAIILKNNEELRKTMSDLSDIENVMAVRQQNVI